LLAPGVAVGVTKSELSFFSSFLMGKSVVELNFEITALVVGYQSKFRNFLSWFMANSNCWLVDLIARTHL